MVRPRTRRRRRQKRRTPRVGGSLGSLLKVAAKLGVRLGKSKRYKRMEAKGVGGAVSKFRRRPWEEWTQDETSSTSIAFFAVLLERSQSILTTRTLQHANADQVNAVSELVLNLFKQNIPVSPATIKQLRPYKGVLRNLGRRKNSIKKRRQWLVAKKGRGLWKGLNAVLCQCLRRWNARRGWPFCKTPTGNEIDGKRPVNIGSINTRCYAKPTCTRWRVYFATRVVPPIVKNCSTLAVPDGRSPHDSSKGVGPTRSILQRVIDRERSAQQSLDLGRPETCLIVAP